MTQDEIAAVNQRHWEEEVRKKGGYTLPWLGLDVELINRYAKGELTSKAHPFHVMYPPESLLGVKGKDVLCLASGGGQQSAVFGLQKRQVNPERWTPIWTPQGIYKNQY